jgi:acetyltransferase-like isoleucine patch superfamily enzyme
VPLQSKDGYETTGSPYAQTTYPPAPQPLSQPRREPLPGYRGQQPLRVDPQHGRPVSNEDERPSASTLTSTSITSPGNRLSAMSHSHNYFPTPTSAASTSYDGLPKPSDYRRIPPLHDPGRENEQQTPQSAQSSSLPQISILHPSSSSSPHTPQSSVQAAAQQALALSTTPARQKTSKEDMLAGRPFFPSDRELVLERERCSTALWRFNNATNPNNGVSRDERHRLFRDILQPREAVNISPTLASPARPQGFVGENITVEAPFSCDYGYNISIGNDVGIGRNCTILDSNQVKIGDRVMIGPNVQILTTTLPIDPKRRLGNRGPATGNAITIEEDCFIGAGVTILPGVTIQRGTTIGAHSLVTHVSCNQSITTRR